MTYLHRHTEELQVPRTHGRQKDRLSSSEYTVKEPVGTLGKSELTHDVSMARELTSEPLYGARYLVDLAKKQMRS